MATKMSTREAEALVLKAIRSGPVADWDKVEPALKRLGKLVVQIDAQVKKAESAEMVGMLLKAARLEARPVAEGIALMARTLKSVDEVTDDDALMATLSKSLVGEMAFATGELEKARNALRAAKEAMDRGEAFLAAQQGDADAAGEDWATAYAEFDRIASAAVREVLAWREWDALAKDAVTRRDHAALQRLRKAPPPSVMLDTVAGWPRGKPFAAFERAHDVGVLPKALRDEIARDQAKAAALYDKAYACSELKAALRARVAGLAVDPLDANKGLKALGLPATALARLKVALEVPVAERVKALDALARQLKLASNGRQMAATLQKAGVF